MSILLIDDEGEWWDGQSGHLKSAYDSPYSGGEFVGYVVRNLGFVALNEYGTSCQIRLNPSLTLPQTIKSLANWLGRYSFRRLAVTWFGKDWHYELFAANVQALERITTLVQTSQTGRPGELLSRQVPIEAIPRDSLLGVLLESWPQLIETSPSPALWNLMQKLLGERYVVVRRNPNSGRLVFSEVGKDMFIQQLPRNGPIVGTPLDDQPDKAYGKWVLDSYQRAIGANRPQIEDCDHIVQWPERGRSRVRYRRLIFPLTTEAEAPVLLAGSIIDPSIDLRIKSR
jgi:hypothetical protein